MSRIRSWFFTGILVMTPLILTIYVVWAFITFVDNLVVPMVPYYYRPSTYLPFPIPGLGLIIVFIFTTFVGILATGLFGRTLIRLWENILSRMPVVRSVYSAIKQILETVMATQSDAFRQAVLVEYPRKDIWAIGFVTGSTKGEVGENVNKKMVNVFMPTTPNPTSGFLLFFPEKDLIFLKMSVEDALKLVVSGGMVIPKNK
ncbi:MAG: DUF502 domain-containing protein [Candidatus Puniceispirillales bacterium]|tara:strand:- start:761 stop:1366 length:606 start_codon:yes stop_codon:yes gene_type:complete